jgi:hypothetical protein
LATLLAGFSFAEGYMLVKRPAVALILVAALAGAAVTTVPGVGFCLAIAMALVIPPSVGHAWLLVPALAFCGGLVWRGVSRADAFFLGWAAWTIMSWRFSSDVTKRTVLAWMVAVSLYAFARYSAATLPQVMFTLLGAGTIIAAVTVYEWAVQRVIFGDPAKYQWAGRAYGTPFRAGSIFGGAPAASIAVAVIMAACLPLLRSKRRRAVIACYAVLLLAEIGTYSRSGWIGLTVGLGMYYAFGPRRHWGRLVYALAAATALLVVAWPRLTATNTYQQGIVRQENTTAREAFLSQAWPLVADSPSHLIFGRGFNALMNPTHPDQSLLRAPDVLNRGGTHNTYVTSMLEQGLIGTVLLVGWLAVAFMSGLSSRRRSLEVLALMSGLAVIAVAAMFHDLMHDVKTVSVVAITAGLLARAASSARTRIV